MQDPLSPSELKPLWPMLLMIGVAQILGAWDGQATYDLPTLFDRMWAGGAAMTLPGFVVGLITQRILRPGVLAKKKLTVILIGGIATILTLAALAVINGVFGAS